ncbi:MAG: hypothetical protein HOV87_33655 [Catenulispora sp.]|nr:hypothetical protein [Catenulispora sp.]
MTISEVRCPADGAQHVVESWHRREPPLPAVAVLGVGAVATALAAATHRRLAEGAALRTVADPEYLVVLGDEAALPWVDGARYLGWDGAALTLTTHRVLPSADVWRSSALAATKNGAGTGAKDGTKNGADDGADDGAENGEQIPDQPTLVIVLPEQVLITAGTITDADPAALAELFPR